MHVLLLGFPIIKIWPFKFLGAAHHLIFYGGMIYQLHNRRLSTLQTLIMLFATTVPM